jgi:glucan biosynthesis protein
MDRPDVLKLGSGLPGESAIFGACWLMKPGQGASPAAVFALLGCVSVTGAHKFVIPASYNTTMELDRTFIPRAAIGCVGIAHLPSLFCLAFWSPKEPLQPYRDYRYRLAWCQKPALDLAPAPMTQTLVGVSPGREGGRLFYVDFSRTEEFNLCDDIDVFCPGENASVELSAMRVLS